MNGPTYSELFALPAPPQAEHQYHPRAPIQPPREAPWEAMPYGAVRFRGGQQFATVTSAATQVLAQVKGSAANVGVVREIHYSINAIAVTTLATFALRINGAPQDGPTNFQFFPKPAATDVQQFDPRVNIVHIPPGAVVDVLVTIADAGSYLCGAYYWGWWYPLELLEAWLERG